MKTKIFTQTQNLENTEHLHNRERSEPVRHCPLPRYFAPAYGALTVCLPRPLYAVAAEAVRALRLNARAAAPALRAHCARRRPPHQRAEEAAARAGEVDAQHPKARELSERVRSAPPAEALRQPIAQRPPREEREPHRRNGDVADDERELCEQSECAVLNVARAEELKGERDVLHRADEEEHRERKERRSDERVRERALGAERAEERPRARARADGAAEAEDEHARLRRGIDGRAVVQRLRRALQAEL